MVHIIRIEPDDNVSPPPHILRTISLFPLILFIHNLSGLQDLYLADRYVPLVSGGHQIP